jgi:hypothetical protein
MTINDALLELVGENAPKFNIINSEANMRLVNRLQTILGVNVLPGAPSSNEVEKSYSNFVKRNDTGKQVLTTKLGMDIITSEEISEVTFEKPSWKDKVRNRHVELTGDDRKNSLRVNMTKFKRLQVLKNVMSMIEFPLVNSDDLRAWLGGEPISLSQVFVYHHRNPSILLVEAEIDEYTHHGLSSTETEKGERMGGNFVPNTPGAGPLEIGYRTFSNSVTVCPFISVSNEYFKNDSMPTHNLISQDSVRLLREISSVILTMLFSMTFAKYYEYITGSTKGNPAIAFRRRMKRDPASKLLNKQARSFLIVLHIMYLLNSLEMRDGDSGSVVTITSDQAIQLIYNKMVYEFTDQELLIQHRIRKKYLTQSPDFEAEVRTLPFQTTPYLLSHESFLRIPRKLIVTSLKKQRESLGTKEKREELIIDGVTFASCFGDVKLDSTVTVSRHVTGKILSKEYDEDESKRVEEFKKYISNLNLKEMEISIIELAYSSRDTNKDKSSNKNSGKFRSAFCKMLVKYTSVDLSQSEMLLAGQFSINIIYKEANIVLVPVEVTVVTNLDASRLAQASLINDRLHQHEKIVTLTTNGILSTSRTVGINPVLVKKQGKIYNLKSMASETGLARPSYSIKGRRVRYNGVISAGWNLITMASVMSDGECFEILKMALKKLMSVWYVKLVALGLTIHPGSDPSQPRSDIMKSYYYDNFVYGKYASSNFKKIIFKDDRYNIGPLTLDGPVLFLYMLTMSSLAHIVLQYKDDFHCPVCPKRGTLNNIETLTTIQISTRITRSKAPITNFELIMKPLLILHNHYWYHHLNVLFERVIFRKRGKEVALNVAPFPVGMFSKEVYTTVNVGEVVPTTPIITAIIASFRRICAFSKRNKGDYFYTSEYSDISYSRPYFFSWGTAFIAFQLELNSNGDVSVSLFLPCIIRLSSSLDSRPHSAKLIRKLGLPSLPRR